MYLNCKNIELNEIVFLTNIYLKATTEKMLEKILYRYTFVDFESSYTNLSKYSKFTSE